MRVFCRTALVIGVAVLAPGLLSAGQQDADRAVAGGGITAAGWKGEVDGQSASQGRSIKDSKFEQKGDTYHLAIGPAAVYWNPSNTASGDYTVKATFTEAKMTSGHPHPMGLFIGGSKLGTPDQALMYCTAYRDGTFIVRRFNGKDVTNIARKTPNAAIKKASSPDESVTQEVAWVVKGGKAECQINGATVASYDKAEIVGAGKLESTDGIYGIRVSHNMDLTVSNLKMTKG
jgi:hypothetical protein